MDRQMQKGVLEMCLLQAVYQEETYGYNLLGKMASAFPDLQERTVYAILRRLATSGYTEIFMVNETKGPVRKYYRITAAGCDRLKVLKTTWGSLVQSVEQSGIEVERLR